MCLPSFKNMVTQYLQKRICVIVSCRFKLKKAHLLPTGSEEREVLGVGSTPVAILTSCQDMKTIAL